MGLFDDLYTGMFDLNGDGHVEPYEEWLSFERTRRAINNTKSSDFSLFSSDDDESDWWIYENEGYAYGIDPFDYKSKEEYQKDLDYAKEHGICKTPVNVRRNPDGSVSVPVNLEFSINYPGKEELSKIKREDFPDQRTYETARYFCELTLDIAIISSDSTKEDEIKKCGFIFSKETVASRYLTLYDGFLYAQAVKENFNLPINIPDEDERPVTEFKDVFSEVAEEDVVLAVDIWAWVVKEFTPYKEYMKSCWYTHSLIMGIAIDFPELFIESIKRLGKDPDFARYLITENTEYPHAIACFISTALKNSMYPEAQRMFGLTVMRENAKSTDIEQFVRRIILNCCDCEGLETIDAFNEYIFPMVEKVNNKRIQRLLPEFRETIDEHIGYVEENDEKYQYSRRYSWRNSCTDGSAYGIDPLNYETEEEYNDAIQNKKYAWRKWRAKDAERYNLNLNDYERDWDFMTAVEKERLKEEAHKNDPKFYTDTTVYTFCGVCFRDSKTVYHYLVGEHEVSVGDTVEVSVGNSGEKRTAEVVSVIHCKKPYAPFPVDKAKKILGVYFGKK